MEGAGSRLGRASSRYGGSQPLSSSSPAKFSGPVRKWQKKWVLVSTPSPTRKTSKNGGDPPGVLLCKWTRLSQSHNPDDAVAGVAEEPPRRKFRYTPITVVEQEEGIRKGKDNTNNEVKTAEKEDNQATRGVEQQKVDNQATRGVDQQMAWNNANSYGHGNRMLNINEGPSGYQDHQVAEEGELFTNLFHTGNHHNNSLLNLLKTHDNQLRDHHPFQGEMPLNSGSAAAFWHFG